MTNYMFVLRPTTKKFKTVCPACAKRGEVLNSCPVCHGCAMKVVSVKQYYVQDNPVNIIKVDRDPDTGILHYWDSLCEFFYETVYPELNKFVPKVPHGIHLCHSSRTSADIECKRINDFLYEEIKKKNN